MRKFKLFFACLLMAVLSIGQVWGATADVTYDFTGSGWTVSNGTLSNGTVSFTGSGPDNFKMNGGYFMIGKNGAVLNFPTYSSAVEKIVVTGRSGASGSTKMNIYVGETAVSTETTGSTGTNTYNIASASQAAGTTYTLKVTSSHNAQVTKIEIFYVSETPGGDPDPGEDPAPTADSYELVTNVSDLAVDDHIIIVNIANSKALSTTQNTNNRGAASVTITNDAIVPGDDVQVLTLGQTNNHWTLYTGSGYLYAASSSSNNMKTQTTNNANGEWAIAIANTGSATLTAQGTNTRNLMRYNSSSVIFSCYGSGQQDIAIFKKSDGTPQKQNAGLSYAEADQKKLAKLGEAFTAPTLVNPNSLAVSYASNNTAVAEVASNGAVTIKAAGVAVITASFAGNDDYKAGSASYTIGVTSHAGTEADPYVAADVKIVIDAVETLENAYATGIVSSIYSTSLPTEGYISFYFSADGNTTGQQIEAYKCYGLNSAPFEALTDVKTGATVVVTGTLKKYNSTYEFDQNCHLISYEAPEVPKTHIANDQANPYTVAQAIAYAADGVTYDLDDYVYVQGVVYDVKSFNNGAMNIFIKDANAENQFELYKCAGINDGNATTPFEALTDVKAGNVVIGYGQLTVYNNVSEFKQGNYLVDLQKPITGVWISELSAEVEAGATYTLTANVLPTNATGTIDWTVESGDAYASVDENGVVTGIAEGEAVIRATAHGTEFYKECTMTVTAATTPVSYDYALVTDAAQLQDGLKVIIVAANEDVAAGSAAATYRYAVDVERTSEGDYLILDTENMPAEFTLGVPAAGQYTFNDGTGYMYENAAKSVKVQADPFNWSITIGDGNIATIQATNELRYNSGSPRFTTYASGQQALQLYVKDDGKQPAGLAWSTDAVELTVGDAFTAPTLNNPNSIAASAITIASDNTDLAVVNDGVVSLVSEATGTAKITASYAGDDTYRAASVSYIITVNAAAPTPAETKNVVIIAEYNSKFYAMTNSLSSGALAAVEVEKDGDKIVVFAEADKAAIQWTMTDNTTTATFQDADDKYLAHSGTGTNLALQADAEDWTWHTDGYYYAVENRTFFYNNSGVFKNYSTSNLPAEKTDYSGAPEIIEIAAEDIILSQKEEPQLAYDPAEVTLTVGETFTPAVLSYAEGFDGIAAVTYASNNEAVATVDESGVVSLVADATGTATITATFAGNNNYLAGSASYLITVNEAGDDLTGTWVLASSVAAGDKFIVVGSYNNKTMAMGKQNSNNRAAVASSVDEWNVLTPGAGTKVFTLVDAGEGKFAIQASNGKYLSAAGTGTNNYLREAADFEADNAKWTISIENGVANVVASSNNRNVMRYNSTNNSELFSCYQSGAQRDIQIFKLGTPDYGSYQRDVTAGRYGTICLPKAGKLVSENVTLYEISYKESNDAVIYLDEVDPLAMEAGMPYIFFSNNDQINVEYTSGVESTAKDNNGLHGTLVHMDDMSGAGIYMISNNELIHSTNSASYLDANRAYIMLGEVSTTAQPKQSNRRRVAMGVQGEQTATGMDELNAAEAPVKVLINGQLFILRGENMFNVNGQLVK